MANERELRIRATADAAQAKEEVASLNAALGETAALQTEGAVASTEASAALTEEAAAAQTVTAATVEQGEAAKAVETILEQKARIAEEAQNREVTAMGRLMEATIAAQFAMKELGDASVVGGAKLKIALAEATGAVAQLEIAQANARAAGGVVTPGQVETLAAYDRTIQATTADLVKGAAAHGVYGEQAHLATGSIHGAARAMSAMAKENDGLMGSFARAALPIGAFIGIMAILPEIIKKIDEHSKSMAKSLVDAVQGFDDESVAAKKAGESLEAYEARVEKVLDAREDVTRAGIAMVAGLIQEEADVQRARAAWQGYEASLTGTFENQTAFVDALKKMGVTFRATHEEMRAEAQLFGLAYATVLKRDGEGATLAWAQTNKNALDKIISYYEEAGKVVPANLRAIQDAIMLTTTAEKEYAEKKELRKHFLDTVNAAEILRMQIEAGIKTYGSEGLAVQALSKDITGQIEELEKLKVTNKEQASQRGDELRALTDLAVKYGILHGKHGEIAQSQQEIVKTAPLLIESLRTQLDHVPRLSREFNVLSQKLLEIETNAKKAAAALDQITAGEQSAGGGHTGPPVVDHSAQE